MNLQTFRAPTMAEALGQEKNTMGQDAVILHTRTFSTRQWLGLKKREIVEITAGRGLNVRGNGRSPGKSGTFQPQYGEVQQQQGGGGGANKSSSGIVIRSDANGGGPRALPSNGNNGNGASTVAVSALTNDVANLTMMVRDLCKQVRHAQIPEIPEELLPYYVQLT